MQHCGPWPISVADEKPVITYPLAFDYPGAITAQAKKGEVTLARFDGDNGKYSLLLGNARGVDGPKGMGTYLWVEVDNIKRLEAKIVEGPYTIIAWGFIRTWYRFSMRHVNILELHRIYTTRLRKS